VGVHEPPYDGDGASVGLVDVRDPLPEELRDPFFPAAVRGYERHSVDAYVQRVNQLVAELQISGSPPAAVRHALDRVGEQTSGILHRARETAEEITRTAREEAEETTARAKAEAAEIVTAAQRRADAEIASRRAAAEEQLSELEAEIVSVADRRGQVLDELRGMVARLEAAIADTDGAGA
jgi:F0F1-type ATP synthase membrane subunit b/b'